MSDASAVHTLQPHNSTRNVGADVLRIAACFSVISIHFLMNIKFYEAPIKGTNMYIMLVMRMLFSVCVPMFIILTGYLMVNRPLSAAHYGKGMKVVWIYLLASLACIIFKIYFLNPGAPVSPDAWKDNLKDILIFRAAPYSWYIEMYFGLYLLIPFLGVLYRALPSRGWKIALIVSLLALNSIPKLLNSFDFETPGWWNDPTLSTQYQRIVPRFWYYNTYPLPYFFIGAYLREYGLRMNGVLHRVLIVVTLGLSTLFELWRSGGGKFDWGVGSDWDFLLTVVLTTLIFALIVQKPYRRMPKPLTKVIRYVSGLTLSMFMVSYIFDELFYKILKEKVPSMPDRLPYYFIIVPAVFLASAALSAVIDLIYRFFGIICSDIKGRVKMSRAKAAPAHAGPAHAKDDGYAEPVEIADSKLAEPFEIADSELAEPFVIADNELAEPFVIADSELAEPFEDTDSPQQQLYGR